MEFRDLKTFQVVANLLSFNKAARVLNYAQSTVSSQILLPQTGNGKRSEQVFAASLITVENYRGKELLF